MPRSIQPRFCILHLPSEILVKIAVETALVDVLGPPAHLIPLLCTCRAVHNTLIRSDLLARIFRAKFDTTAVRRRFGDVGWRNRHLARQLRIYCAALRRIRARCVAPQTLEGDLWTAFIMMSENDGRNATHLLEWAGMYDFVDRLVRTGLALRTETGWPVESTVNNLSMWLLWMATDIDTLRAESNEAREQFVKLVLPFVVAGFRYPALHAADVHFFLPLHHDDFPALPTSVQTAHGEWPQYPVRILDARRPLVLYGQRTTLALPPIAHAAQMLYFARRGLNGLALPPGLPADRAHALALGERYGPTVADYAEFNATPSTRTMPRLEWDSHFAGLPSRNGFEPPPEEAEELAAAARARGESGWRLSLTLEQVRREEMGAQRFGLRAPSAAWDCDWERWVACYDPFTRPPETGPKYWMGSLVGSWVGRLLLPDEHVYMHMIEDPVLRPFFSEFHPYLALRPLNVTFRELHCVCPGEPIAIGGDRDARESPEGPISMDDGIKNAYLPPSSIDTSADKFTFRDIEEGTEHVYMNYVPDAPPLHNAETCTHCGAPRARGGDVAMVPPEAEALFEAAGLGREEGADDGDGEVDEDEFTIEAADSGVRDIAFAGYTERRHGDAWGHYDYFGRLRPWDGLIALVAIPNDVNHTVWGKWIFRGYLHGGQNFVGRCRGSAYDIHHPGYEAPFTLSRREPFAG